MHHVIKRILPKARLDFHLKRLVKGWRIRKILNGCTGVIDFRKDLASIEGELLAFTDPADKRINKAMKLRKFKIEDLTRLVHHIEAKGRWLLSYQRIPRD